METDLSLNEHRLRGSVHSVNGILNTNNGNTFLLNGCDKIIIPDHSRIVSLFQAQRPIYAYFFKSKTQ